jgi:hypothetical protein
MTIEANPFTKVDWYGWMGAEPPDAETEPLLGYMVVLYVPPAPDNDVWITEGDGRNGVVIADKGGITINFMSEHSYANALQINCEFRAAVTWLKYLTPTMKFQDFIDLGFMWI